MNRTITATTLILAIVATACGSGLTDPQTVWCTEDWESVQDAKQALSLKDWTQVWYENRGAIFNEEGNVESEEAFAEADKEWLPDIEGSTLDAKLEFNDAVNAEWLEHPHGTRACIAAYDSR